MTEEPGAGLLAVTSPDRLHAGWLAACGRGARRGSARAVAYRAHAGAAGPPGAAVVTVLDRHPAAHAWLGAPFTASAIVPAGAEPFGQAGTFRTSIANTE